MEALWLFSHTLDFFLKSTLGQKKKKKKKLLSKGTLKPKPNHSKCLARTREKRKFLN